MDREEAKFILSSFRPDGSDAHEESFEQALALALEDQELSQWMADERAFDGAFAAELSEVSVPATLRDDILDNFDLEVDKHNEVDKVTIGALATIQPPAHLKQEILIGMAASQVQKDESKIIPFAKYAYPIAAAAVIAVALFLGSTFSKSGPEVSVALENQRLELLDMIQNHEMSHDYVSDSLLQTVSWGQREHIPMPEALPHSLQGCLTKGCKKLDIEGYEGCLICFATPEAGMVHLVVMDLDGQTESLNQLPLVEAVKEQCQFCQQTRCSIATWQDGEKAYLLFSRTAPVETFQQIF